MAKKANTKAAKKTSVKQPKEESVETPKTVDNMSVDELAEIFKNNDTEKIEQLADENSPTVAVENEPEENKEPEFPEHVYVAPEPFVEEKTEQVNPKKVENPKAEPKQEKKVEEPKKKEAKMEPVQPAKPKTPNTNRAVYGYDHFGMIYSY